MTGRYVEPGVSRDRENASRRSVGLPKDVQLVFYPEPENAESREDILSWDIAENRGSYSLLEVVTESRTYRVHSGIVSFMQEPDFIEQNTRELWD